MAEDSATYPRRGRAMPRRLTAERAGRVLGSLLEDRPLARLEVVVMAALLTFVAAVVLGPYISRGGFYSDDWVLASWAKYPPHGGVLGTLHAFDSIRYRPGQFVYDPIIHTVLGLHMRAFLLWAALCAVAMSVAFYVFLRYFAMRRLEAGAAAVLALVFPYSSSTRLWSTSAVVSITVVLYLVGTLLVLRSLSGHTRRPLLVHVAGTTLVMAGVMTYEIVAPAVLLSVLLYSRVTTWRRAVKSWLVDLALVGATLIFVTSGRNQPIGTFHDQLNHAWIIAQQGADLWSRVLVPYGIVPTRLAMGVLVGVAAASGLVAYLLPRASAARRDISCWLGFLGAGVVATSLGYAMYVPADVYYSPDTLGVGDRTNGFAVLGWVLVTVALARLVATLVFRDLSRSRIAVAAAVALAACLVGLGYVDRLRTEADAYAASFREQTSILGTMKQTLPHPPHGSTIYLVRSVPWTAPGVPVFVQPWELVGTVKLFYHDPSLSGYPVVSPGVVIHCGAHAAEVTPPGYGGPTPYGRAFVVDMASRTTSLLDSRATCKRVTAAVGVAAAPTA